MKTLASRWLPATLLLALLVPASGCQKKAASKLTGQWNLMAPEKIAGNSNDSEDDSRQQAAENVEDLYDSMADGEVNGMMSLIFHRNGKLETYTDFPMASSGKPKIGRWSLVSWDDNKHVATLKCEILDSVTETRVTFVDDDTIQLVPPNIAVLGTELRFRRKR